MGIGILLFDPRTPLRTTIIHPYIIHDIKYGRLYYILFLYQSFAHNLGFYYIKLGHMYSNSSL